MSVSRESGAQHPMTRGSSLPEPARTRTSEVVLASIPIPWYHLEERRVPGPPTERALDPPVRSLALRRSFRQTYTHCSR